MNIKHWEDWYHVTRDDFVSNGGFGLLKWYHNSVVKTIQAILPNHPWQIARFASSTVGYWNNKKIQKGIIVVYS